MTDSFTVEDPAHARLTHEILILTIPGTKRPANPTFRFPASGEEEFAREHEFHISLTHVRHLAVKTVNA